MIQALSSKTLHILGWRTQGQLPPLKKMVLIGAYHTSNWDFVFTLLALGSMGIRFNWVAKHTLFRWPLGFFFRRIGGLPVNRSSATGFLRNCIELFNTRESLVLAIAPEGTRSYTTKWKSGFYTLALKADVPVVMGYIDYPSKVVGMGEMFYPCGDFEKDRALIESFYRDKRGKYPDKQSPV